MLIINKKQLLCTFANGNNYSDLCIKISNFYTISDKKIFVFINEKNSKEYYLTYNIYCCDTSPYRKFPNTISIHRKKIHNVLYTLNGMNKLISEENNGVFDRSFQLDWELYKNSLILTTEVGIKIVELRLVDLIAV